MGVFAHIFKDDYYKRMQVDNNAGQEAVEAAYHRLSQNANYAEMELLNEAYQTLGTLEIRREYDSWLKAGGGQGHPEAKSSLEAAASKPMPSEKNSLPESSQVRPWVRFFAKLIDLYLWWLICWLIVFGALKITGTSTYVIKDKELPIGLVIMALWVFYEAALIFRVGTTPGKWLLNTRIVPLNPQGYTYLASVRRSFKSITEGLALGFPFISLITALIARNRLIKQGSTTWDLRYRFRVIHRKLSMFKIVLVVFLYLVFIFLVCLVISLVKNFALS